MRYSTLLYTFLLAGSTVASALRASSQTVSNHELVSRQSTNCGPKNVRCNDKECNGVNDSNGGPGRCLSGTYEGCACDSICGKRLANCDFCEGLNDFSGDPGLCTTTEYKGCQCRSICNNSLNSCDKNGCNGISVPGGLSGICTAGKYIGCLCGSVCGKNGPCSDCGGDEYGICHERWRGCPCNKDSGEHQCESLTTVNCDKDGCNGVYNEKDGFGICQSGGKIKGCACHVNFAAPLFNPFGDEF